MIKEQWALMYCAWGLSGLVVALALLAIPQKFLVWVSVRVSWFTPDFITLGRLLFVYAGFVLVFANTGLLPSFIGLQLIVVGQVLDRMDGKLADGNDASGIPGLTGRTVRGKWLDPLADKLSNLPFYIWMIVIGIIPWWLSLTMIMIETFGTVIRKPFNKKRPFRVFRAMLRSEEATGVGKAKMALQAFTMLACLPYIMHWVESPLWIPRVMFGAATVLAGLSVLSKIHINRDVDAMTDLVTSLFSHR